MPKRTESSLYPKAAEIADRLAARLGNQKLVLSAGAVLLAKLDPNDREVACAEGKGQTEESLDLYAERRTLLEIRKWIDDARLGAALAGVKEARMMYSDLAQIVDRGLASRIQRGEAVSAIRQASAVVQRLVIPTPDEVEEINRLRELLGPGDEELAARAAEASLPDASRRKRKKDGTG